MSNTKIELEELRSRVLAAGLPAAWGVSGDPEEPGNPGIRAVALIDLLRPWPPADQVFLLRGVLAGTSFNLALAKLLGSMGEVPDDPRARAVIEWQRMVLAGGKTPCHASTDPDASEPIDTEEDPEYVFEGLQGHYTGLLDGRWVWLLTREMGVDDFRRNIARFRREAAAKLAHAEALDAELWRRMTVRNRVELSAEHKAEKGTGNA
jgi:hypothetical protein